MILKRVSSITYNVLSFAVAAVNRSKIADIMTIHQELKGSGDFCPVMDLVYREHVSLHGNTVNFKLSHSLVFSGGIFGLEVQCQTANFSRYGEARPVFWNA